MVVVVSQSESFMQLEGGLAFNLIVDRSLGLIDGFAFRSSHIKGLLNCSKFDVLSALNPLKVLYSFCICISFTRAF